MPLQGPSIKAKFKDTIYSGLKREFMQAVSQGQGYPPIADEFWLKLANAISDIAIDMVDEIQSNAQVVPGQQVVTNGGPSSQVGATVSPGKIK
jgi:tRNA A37 threonylcarbamoyltransferase TsaD